MLTKTFRAKNMLMALQSVQTELGSDALILSMREVPSGPIWAAWKKPGIEVIASKPDKNHKLERQNIDVGHKVEKKQPTTEELKREIELLKMISSGQTLPEQNLTNHPQEKIQAQPRIINKQVDNTKFDNTDFRYLPDTPKNLTDSINEKVQFTIPKAKITLTESIKEPELPGLLADIKTNLNDQGIRQELIQKIIESNIEAFSPSILNDQTRLKKFVTHQLTACLPPMRKSVGLLPGKIMALVGASGSGKTSTCAKLASFYTITMGKKVVWIEADTIRTSAISESRTYTETLGIPLFLAYTPQELVELIDSQSDADLILIDTTSYNPRKEDSLIELASFLTCIPSGSTYFIASATTKEQDLIEAEKSLKQFGLKGVILTKLDETGSFGATFNLLYSSKLPLYFISCGNQIFGDLKPGVPEQLASAIVEGKFLK